MSRVGRASCLVALGLGVFAAAPASAAPRGSRVLDPKLDLLDRAPALRARTQPGLALAGATVPVVVTLDRAVDAGALAALERAGVELPRDARGRAFSWSKQVAAEAPKSALAALAQVPGVRRVELDGPMLRSPAPLDLTAHLIQADAAWRSKGKDGTPITGAGITICDVDGGTDIYHPSFFRADGGYFDWVDENDSGTFEPGQDSVDLGQGPVIVRAMNGVVAQYWDGQPLFGTEDPAYDPAFDYVYADENGDGERNFGKAAGFGETSPSFGERFLVPDDVNGNGKLDPGEKLVALSTSKIAAFRYQTKVYRRGENLLDSPAFDESMLHGVGSSGVMVAGQPGLSRLVGMAPDADLIMATDTDGNRQVQMTRFCVQEGARVVLHEYAPWVGYHLDGSSSLEQLIDESFADGVVHINPAGNLSTAQKLMKRPLLAGETRDITIEVPNIGATVMVGSFLWRDARDLAFSITSPGGDTAVFGSGPNGFQIPIDATFDLYGASEDSSRGTRMVYFYVFAHDGSPTPVTVGDWKITVTDPTAPGGPPVTLIGYVEDEISGWGQGMRFVADVTEDHLIGWPGTADHGLAVAAYTGHGDMDAISGDRAYYSGRGRRIDDAQILWISGPDNPIVPAHFEAYDLAWMQYGGTSGASPHVAGAAALILASDPTLTAEEVRTRIGESAVVDAQTGTVPNEDFGNGKLDVYGAIFGEAPPAGSAPVVDDQSFDVTADAPTVEVVATDPDGDALVLELDREYDGVYDQTASAGSLDLGVDAPGDYVMKVRATDPSGRTDTALLRVHVEAPLVIDPSIHVAGGGGCTATAAAPRSPVPFGALLLGALVGLLGARAARQRRPRP
jgi:subtilisin family serine protease